ncbi:MAG: CPBP family intramembrane metalloprotease [Candidatus Lokiarchaeota archaeon]|nr:CPBP family intramembrane metalloprotease [Candidatus Lokiarchaeota archaeon]
MHQASNNTGVNMIQSQNQKLNFILSFVIFIIALILQVFLFGFIQLFFQELSGWQFDQMGQIVSYGAIWGIWVGLIITEVMLGVIVLIIFYFRGISTKDLFKKSEFKLYYIFIGISLAYIVGTGASIIQYLIMTIFQLQYPESITVLTEFLTPKNAFEVIVWIAIMFGVVAPCEELFARGLLQKGFDNSLKNKKNGHLLAIIFSSVCFTIFHIDPFRFFPIFCESLVISYVYYKTDDLLSVILIHAFLNSFIIALSMLGI